VLFCFVFQQPLRIPLRVKQAVSLSLVVLKIILLFKLLILIWQQSITKKVFALFIIFSFFYCSSFAVCAFIYFSFLCFALTLSTFSVIFVLFCLFFSIFLSIFDFYIFTSFIYSTVFHILIQAPLCCICLTLLVRSFNQNKSTILHPEIYDTWPADDYQWLHYISFTTVHEVLFAEERKELFVRINYCI